MATLLAASSCENGVGMWPKYLAPFRLVLFCLTGTSPYKNVPYFTLQMYFLVLPNPTPPHPTLLHPILPYRTLPYLAVPYRTLPTRPHPTPPYRTVPYLALPNMHVSFHPGRESSASLYKPRNPSWHLATTCPRICARYRNSLSSSAASPRDRSSGDCVRAGISKLNRSRFAKSATRNEQRKTTHAHMLPNGQVARVGAISSRIGFGSGIPRDADLVSPLFK